MPLELYQRGDVYWVRGRPADGDRYLRASLGTADPAIAAAAVREIESAARKRRFLGPDAPRPEDELTFSSAVLLYDAAPADARYLVPIVKRLGATRVRDITPAGVRKLARELLPTAATDTWQRQVLTPVRAVINNAHELGHGPPIRIKAFDRDERLKQDRLRGKESRVARTPGSWPWLRGFMAAADPRDAALAFFVFTTGARLGQSTTMRRSTDLDLSAGRVRLPAAKGHAAEWIDILPELVALIANLRRPRNRRAWDLVFYTAAGHASAIYRRWRRACAAAGIEYLPPHAAGRHGFGTEMIVRQGIDPATVAKAGRWSSPIVPMKTYAHAEDTKAKIRAALEAGQADSGTPRVQPQPARPAKSRAANAD
jgi:integrase